MIVLSVTCFFHLYLLAAFVNSGVNHLATENSINAFKLRDRVSERERLYIDSRYYGNVTGEKKRSSRYSSSGGRNIPRSGAC